MYKGVVWLIPLAMTYAMEQAEKEIQRDKADLKRLKKRYPGYDFVPVDSENQPQYTPRTDFTDLETTVLAVVTAAVDKEWTSREVFQNLREKGSTHLPEKEDAAMNAVGAALVELTRADLVRRSFIGKGRAPHRYTSIVSMEKEAAPEENAS